MTNDEKVIGTVEITISSTNFKDMKTTITVSSVEKIVPEGTPTASPSTITYGQSISVVTLSGQMSDGTDRVDGGFTWDNPNATPDAGTYQAAWTFTPTDTGRYTTATGTVTITVRKATPSLTLTPSSATLPNGGTVTLTLSGLPSGGSATVTCSEASITVTKGSGNTWTAELPAGGASYTFTATYAGDGNHNGATANCTVKVTSNRTNASSGSAVTLTVTPDSGYVLDTLTVTDSRGNEIKLTAQGGGKYTFTMPSRAVTVKATFALLPDDTQTPCDGGADCPSREFTDLGSVGTWYHEAVDYVLRNGLMNGYSNGAFGPNDNLSRAQFAQILFNKEGRPVVNYLLQYSDVADGAWYTEAIRWATSQGIVGGYGNGTFGPNDNITREQLAVMLHLYNPFYVKKGRNCLR